jgi:hypothetical protein
LDARDSDRREVDVTLRRLLRHKALDVRAACSRSAGLADPSAGSAGATGLATDKGLETIPSFSRAQRMIRSLSSFEKGCSVSATDRTASKSSGFEIVSIVSRYRHFRAPESQL